MNKCLRTFLCAFYGKVLKKVLSGSAALVNAALLCYPNRRSMGGSGFLPRINGRFAPLRTRAGCRKENDRYKEKRKLFHE